MDDNKVANKKRIRVIITVITVIASVLAIVEHLFNIFDMHRNSTSIEISGDNNTAVSGDYVYNDYSSNDTYKIENYYLDAEQLDELKQARIYIEQDDYDKALSLYEQDKYYNNPEALINLGYIYARGLSYKGVDYQKAADYYSQADCNEALYNLMALFLRINDSESAVELMKVFFTNDDRLVLSYIDECFEKAKIEKGNVENVDEIVDLLLQWRVSGERYNGYNPPSDTNTSKWIISGIIFAGNTPLQTYDEYKPVYTFAINNLERLYFIDDNALVPIP